VCRLRKRRKYPSRIPLDRIAPAIERLAAEGTISDIGFSVGQKKAYENIGIGR
jgi:hypothetical protein